MAISTPAGSSFVAIYHTWAPAHNLKKLSLKP